MSDVKFANNEFKLLVPPETMTWELVSQGPSTFTQRLPVQNGWIYRTAWNGALACCFVEDTSSPGPAPPPPLNRDFP